MGERAERRAPGSDPASEDVAAREQRDLERLQLAGERERLADERERLADERARTADEQERLADERERLADYEERTADDSQQRADQTAEWAHEELLRADARVRRSLAERVRARAAVERLDTSEERSRARAERERIADELRPLTHDEATWSSERRDFVAADRAGLADGRDADADERDRMARRREHEADERDQAVRAQEERVAHAADVSRSATRRGTAAELANRDLAAVRESARRQRAAADEARGRAASDRAEAGRRRIELGTSSGPFGGWLAAEVGALTKELFASQDLFVVAERVAALSTECVSGAVACGITFFEGVRPLAHVTTDDIAMQLDTFQIAQAEGPVGDSIELGETVTVGDLSSDGRWPSFRALATELGVSGVIACELAVQRGRGWESLGALTVYAETPGAFDDEAAEAVALFAAHLSVVTAFDRDRHDVVRREAALHRALGSRDVIGQAKGILMERQHLSAGEAFDVLRRSSQQLNIRLNEVAARLAETGELPE